MTDEIRQSAARQAPAARSARTREIICRTILSPSGISDFGYSLNPYIGCVHACVYCYAHYMELYSGHTEPWGTFVDVKMNAPQVLIRQLRRIPPSSIFMSSVTDPYQPVERRYRLTRRLLEILAPLPHFLWIHTKSSLVERDIDLLRRFKNLRVTFTIVTGDERAARLIEPGAPPVRERIRTLSRLARAGIRTSVFLGPIIPFVTERGLERLLRAIAGAGVRKIALDDLHYLERVSPRLIPALRRYDPQAPYRLPGVRRN